MNPTSAVPADAATLPSGRPMPLLGFGTWQLTDDDATHGVAWALEAGYRHLDTATIYCNEAEVGAALAASAVSRDDVFVTTKIPPDHAGRELATLRTSLELLQTDRVDLWLIHWTPEEDVAGSGVGIDLWQALIQAREQGLATDIGVSNYSLAQIDELVAATGVTPAVNQIEWSPFLFDAEMVAGLQQRGIILEGYSALRGGTLTHPTIVGIADRLGRTPAQVIIRWHLEHGTVVIPKSREQQRIVSNADDVAALDALAGTPSSD